VTCSTCSADVLVTIVIRGNGGVSHLCQWCYFTPPDVVVAKGRRR
jgi:hypothetical protein